MKYQLQVKIDDEWKRSEWHRRLPLLVLRKIAKEHAGRGYNRYRVIELPSKKVIYQPRFVFSP